MSPVAYEEPVRVRKAPDHTRSEAKRCSTPATYGDASYRKFLEIFSGAGGLTQAVRRSGQLAMEPEDIMVENGKCKLGEFDLTCPNVFKKVAGLIKRGQIKWLHLAPPCATFSQARKDGLRAPWGSRARTKLRAKMEQADILARNTFRLASMQIRAGGFVSIENPEHSLIWKINSAQ